MKTNLTFRSQFLALLMAVLICSHPFIVVAQQDSTEIQAKLDAEADINKLTWGIYGFAGCLGVALTTAAGAAIGETADTGFLEFENTIRGGCCGFIGGSAVVASLIVSYKIIPPPERFIGKSPEYVDVYTDAYKSKTRQLRAKWTAVGAAIPSAAFLIGVGFATAINGSSN